MAENESIKKHIEDCEHRIGNILGFMESNSDANTSSCEKNISVLKTVIIALEEIQQYRAIGLTPTMVKDLIKSCKKHEKNALENAHIVDEYSAIGTIEELKALKEKAEPKKPIQQATTEKTHYKCPCCNNIMQTIYRDGVAWGHIANYCEWCGQKIDRGNDHDRG